VGKCARYGVIHAKHGAERGLLDPFDPVQALPKAAQLLRELKDQVGNLGLAVAAYNAGPPRVRDWLAGPCACGLCQHCESLCWDFGGQRREHPELSLP
jgi:hypothetical protein